MIKVKCLTEHQMTYILANHENKTAKQMADSLRVEEINVSLFCQKNSIEPVPRKGSERKRKDTFHAIPDSRRLRMKRVGYNGPQKKTA